MGGGGVTGADSKADNFLVDIKGPTLAFLPVLALEGGTRRNIPKFEVGTLLYARLFKTNPNPDMNPELPCTDASGKAAGFGLLQDGYNFSCSANLSRMLLRAPEDSATLMMYCSVHQTHHPKKKVSHDYNSFGENLYA